MTREELKKLYYWAGFELRPKRCRDCYFMPSNPEEDKCAAMDKQIRDPEMVWDYPMGEYGRKVL